MSVNLSVKNVPEAVATKLRERAERNHRSLQGELMAILEAAAIEPHVVRVNASGPNYEVQSANALADTLLDRLMQIAGERGKDMTKRLSRNETLARQGSRKSERKK